MFNHKKIVAIIPARAGSKRVPKKNIRHLAGKPLIAYTIETALACKMLDRVIVSTEDQEIAEIARKYGAEVPFLRPQELAEGNVSVWTVLKHTVRELARQEEYIADIVVSLSPCAPFRKVEDIEKCLEKLLAETVDLVTTVYQAERSPYFNMLEQDEKGRVSLVKKPSAKITESQTSPKVYSMNDAVNVVKREVLLKTNFILDNKKRMALVEMPRERSIDIDEEFDFQLAECLIKNYQEYGRK